jgi:hypothetical protein
VLRLAVNEEKSPVAKLDQCVFLGFAFMWTNWRWSDEAYADCRHRLRRLTGRSWGVSRQYRLLELREYLRGWMGYFGISDYYRPVPELDHWLRRRVRLSTGNSGQVATCGASSIRLPLNGPFRMIPSSSRSIIDRSLRCQACGRSSVPTGSGSQCGVGPSPFPRSLG